MSTTYRRVEYAAYGDASKLRVAEVPRPAPESLGAKQVLIEVHACSLNPVDYKFRNGDVRLLASVDFPSGIGYDLAGVVLAKGSEVTRLEVGDRVSSRSRTQGSFAELAVVDEDVVAKLPDSVSFVEGAGLPLAGQTALQALRALGLKPGESILICGGAGGVGSFAIQLAKRLFKASRVVATASASKHGVLKSLGADECIDYRAPTLSGIAPVDVIFDAVGDWRQFAPLAKPGRRIVSVAAMPDPDGLARAGFKVNFVVRGLLWLLSARDRFTASSAGLEYYYVWLSPNAKDLATLLDAVADKSLRVIADDPVRGLDNYLDAFKRIEGGRVTGKVVLVVKD